MPAGTRAFGCGIRLHCIALQYIVAFRGTVQRVYDRAFFLGIGRCHCFIPMPYNSHALLATTTAADPNFLYPIFLFFFFDRL